MDPVTLILIGLAVAQGVSGVIAANKQAKAITKSAAIEAQNKAKETRIRAARAQVSFLSSGLSLEGTPEQSIENLFITGQKDISNIRANAQTEAKNLIGAARNSAIFGVAMAAAPAVSGGFSSQGFAVPGTGASATTSAGGTIIPGSKPAFIKNPFMSAGV